MPAGGRPERPPPTRPARARGRGPALPHCGTRPPGFAAGGAWFAVGPGRARAGLYWTAPPPGAPGLGCVAADLRCQAMDRRPGIAAGGTWLAVAPGRAGAGVVPGWPAAGGVRGGEPVLPGNGPAPPGFAPGGTWLAVGSGRARAEVVLNDPPPGRPVPVAWLRTCAGGPDARVSRERPPVRLVSDSMPRARHRRRGRSGRRAPHGGGDAGLAYPGCRGLLAVRIPGGALLDHRGVPLPVGRRWSSRSPRTSGGRRGADGSRRRSQHRRRHPGSLAAGNVAGVVVSRPSAWPGPSPTGRCRRVIGGRRPVLSTSRWCPAWAGRQSNT